MVTLWQTASIPRVVARVGQDGASDVTLSPGLSFTSGTSQFRGAASLDGANYWATGSNQPVQYGSLSSAAVTPVSTGPVSNNRCVNLFGSQLFISTGFANPTPGTAKGVYSLPSLLTDSSSGIPINSTVAIDTGDASSPFDFVLFDTNADSAFDRAYIADDRTAATGGGLLRYDLSGGAWSLTYTLTDGLGGAGLRGLTGLINAAGQAELWATTAPAVDGPNALVRITDLGGASAFNTLATAAPNTIFRGVDFAPVPAPGAWVVLSSGAACVLRRRRPH